MYSKKELRAQAKNIRKSIDIELISSKILDNLINLPEFKSSKTIFSYYSFQEEIKTELLFKNKEKNWYIPKIADCNLLVCKFDEKSLLQNKYGISEPSANNLKEIENKNDIDMIILPALMSDKKGYRLGYGKGFYDRFVNSLEKSIHLVTLVPQQLLVEELPTEPHDCKCHIIITENTIYRV